MGLRRKDRWDCGFLYVCLPQLLSSHSRTADTAIVFSNRRIGLVFLNRVEGMNVPPKNRKSDDTRH